MMIGQDLKNGLIPESWRGEMVPAGAAGETAPGGVGVELLGMNGVGPQSMEQWAGLLDSLGLGIISMDAQGTIVMVSGLVERMWESTSSQLVGQNMARLLLPQECEEPGEDAREKLYRSLECGNLDAVECSGVRANQSRFPVGVRLAYARVDGRVLQNLVVEDHRGEPPTAGEEAVAERYVMALREATEGIWDWSFDSNRMRFSPKWKSMLGYEGSEIGDSPDEWFGRVHPNDRYVLKSAIDSVVNGASVVLEEEYRILHKDGSYRWMLNRGGAVGSGNGRVQRMAGSQIDITDRRAHDSLTGLPNRALFLERLDRLVARSQMGGESLFATLFLDLDRFKLINDSLGHQVGDRLLVAIARRLEGCIRPKDMVARLGGDEFTVLVDGIENITDAIRVVERIQRELSKPFVLDPCRVVCTASIGIAVSRTGYRNADDMVRDADMAMYRAKSRGGGAYEIFDSKMREAALARMNLEMDLRRAVDLKQFRLFYQPIVNLKSGRVVAMEALLRWDHPERGLMRPGEFLAVAEEIGLLNSIGLWVVRNACERWVALRAEFPSVNGAFPGLCINISGREVMGADLPRQIGGILLDSGLDPRKVTLEFAENAVMERAESAVAVLSQLKSLGVQISIDDFGTGYSSLSYLHRFPIDHLKVDGSFVKRLGIDEESMEIIRTIVGLAENLGMDVVAEGVESVRQLDCLKELGCTFGQGNLMSEPVPAEAVGALVGGQPLSIG